MKMNNMNKIQYFLLILFFLFNSVRAQESISLSGTWMFRLDESDKGIANNWQNELFTNQILLPGTTDEAKYGTKTIGAEVGMLTREYKYIGPAWYQKEIEIPLT